MNYPYQVVQCRLADGSYSPPIDVITYVTRVPHRNLMAGPRRPLLAFKGEQVKIFIDKSHPLFRTYRMRAEPMVAAEVAQFLYEANRRLLPSETPARIAFQI